MTQSNTQGYGKAIALSVFAYAAFTVSDALRKFMAVDYKVIDILFWQAIFGIAIMFVFSRYIGGASSIWTSERRNWHIARGVLMALNTSCSLMAISQVPLMDAYTIFFLTPFVTTLVFAIFLKEKIGIYSLSAIVAGFIGGVIAFRPGFVDLHPAYLYAVACLFFFSFSNLVVRYGKINASRSTISLGFWPLLFVAVWTLIYSGGYVPYHNIWFLFVCGVIGLSYTAALITIAHSYALAPASEIAPYQYLQFLFALIMGYLLFGAVPDAFKILGGCIIMGSGIYLFHRQKRKAKEAVSL